MRQLTDERRVQLATEMYERWQQGEPKSRLEIEYWDNPTAHGKAFSGYVKRWLGVDTERRSSQSAARGAGPQAQQPVCRCRVPLAVAWTVGEQAVGGDRTTRPVPVWDGARSQDRGVSRLGQ